MVLTQNKPKNSKKKNNPVYLLKPKNFGFFGLELLLGRFLGFELGSYP